MDTGTLLWLGAGLAALFSRQTGGTTPGASGVIGATPGVIPGTVLPPGGSTTPVVIGGGAGTPNVNPGAVGPGATTALPGVVSVSRGTLSVDQIRKIAASMLKKIAGFFRKDERVSGVLDLGDMNMDAETRAAWESYRAGEWHVDPDGMLVVDSIGAPVLNLGFSAITNPEMLDVPLLVPSDYMLLNEHVPGFDVNLSKAFTADTTQDVISQMAHEEMRLYIDSLPPLQAEAFVTDAATLTGYTRSDVLQGLNALGLVVGALSIYQGIAQGDPISILGGVASVVSNLYQLAGLGELPGLAVLTGILGIAAGIMHNNWLGVISGTIGVITGVTTLASAGALGASAAALMATEALTTVLAVLSVLTVVIAVIGFMISNDMSKHAEQYASEIREHAEIVKEMAVAWPQLVNGHKAALLLRFVSVLPPSRHVEALRIIFARTRLGQGAAISRFLGAGGQGGPFGTGDVSAFEAVSGIYSADCVIGMMRTEEALLRLGVQVDRDYPLGVSDAAWLLNLLTDAMHAYGMGPVIDPFNADQYILAQVTPSGALLDPIFPPTERVCLELIYDPAVDAYVGCAQWGFKAGSGFSAKFWRGNEEEMIMAVVAYYNPNWKAVLHYGPRLQFIGTYPVPLAPDVEAQMRRQFGYLSAVLASGVNLGMLHDPWYDPTMVVPPESGWPAPAPGPFDFATSSMSPFS